MDGKEIAAPERSRKWTAGPVLQGVGRTLYYTGSDVVGSWPMKIRGPAKRDRQGQARSRMGDGDT